MIFNLDLLFANICSASGKSKERVFFLNEIVQFPSKNYKPSFVEHSSSLILSTKIQMDI